MQVVILLCYNSYGAGSEAAALPRRRKRECPPTVSFRVSGAGRSSTLKVDLQHKPPARQLAEARRRLQHSHLQAQPAACWPSISCAWRHVPGRWQGVCVVRGRVTSRAASPQDNGAYFYGPLLTCCKLKS